MLGEARVARLHRVHEVEDGLHAIQRAGDVARVGQVALDDLDAGRGAQPRGVADEAADVVDLGQAREQAPADEAGGAGEQGEHAPLVPRPDVVRTPAD